MYKIEFYCDQNGKEPVLQYLEELASKNDKDSRIKLNKIRDYMKKTQKTPKREIEQAKRNMKDLVERSIENE